MASSLDYINYICEKLNDLGNITYKKMFGEYMIYLNSKPIIIVCDNTAYVKKIDCIKDKMAQAPTGTPYEGAKEHYVLDVDDLPLCKEVLKELEKQTPLPKKKNTSK